ncbi:MAG: hypothetical protein PHY47_22950 [Lachnospiraceae bacterium]|nr:hypothetical protein [Lachnospiraceae bacterium]
MGTFIRIVKPRLPRKVKKEAKKISIMHIPASLDVVIRVVGKPNRTTHKVIDRYRLERMRMVRSFLAMRRMREVLSQECIGNEEENSL